MNRSILITETENFIRQCHAEYDTGHDWWHIERVRRLSLFINKQEKIADSWALEIAALLHDSVDSKFAGKSVEKSYRNVERFLDTHEFSSIKEKVMAVIRNVSFSNRIQSGDKVFPELLVVQDADRLDAIGAIGIARAFNYGGFRNNIIYNPDIKLSSAIPDDKQLQGTLSTISHFYSKLLVIKYRMNTLTAKRLAAERHDFMEAYLKQFYKEWYFGSGKSVLNDEF